MGWVGMGLGLGVFVVMCIIPFSLLVIQIFTRTFIYEYKGKELYGAHKFKGKYCQGHIDH